MADVGPAQLVLEVVVAHEQFRLLQERQAVDRRPDRDGDVVVLDAIDETLVAAGETKASAQPWKLWVVASGVVKPRAPLPSSCS